MARDWGVIAERVIAESNVSERICESVNQVRSRLTNVQRRVGRAENTINHIARRAGNFSAMMGTMMSACEDVDVGKEAEKRLHGRELWCQVEKSS